MNPKAASEIGKPQVFRSSVAVVIWLAWLAFVVANLIDLAVQGRDHVSLIAAAILILSAGVAYVAAQRPRVIAADDALTIKNPLRDHRIPWTSISRVDVSDLLRVHCKPPGQTGTGAGAGAEKVGKGKAISAWAVHYSRRRQYSADVKARRDALRSQGPRARMGGGMSQFGIPQSRRAQPSSYGAAPQEAEALRIVRVLNDRVAAAGIAEASARDSDEGTILASQAAGNRPGETLTSTWSPLAVAALAIPAVLLVIVCLI